MKGLMLSTTRVAANVCVVMACTFSAAAAEEPLLEYLPGETTNAIAVVRVAEILKSHGTQASEGLPVPGAESIPTWIERLVVGSQVRLGLGERVRSLAIAELQSGTNLEEVIATRGGVKDTIGNFSVAAMNQGDYVVGLTQRRIARVRPGVRQEVARWLESLKTRPQPVSPFLKEAAGAPQHVVLALDLRDALAADRVARWLESRPAGTWGRVEPRHVAAHLTRVVGASLSFNPGPDTDAVVRVRFQGPVSLDAGTAHKLFNELLRDAHASLPELETAKPTVQGSELVLNARLSEDGIRRVFSLLSAPSKPEPAQPAATEVSADAAKVSQKYFRSVDGVLRDLDRANRRATDYSRTAVWHDNFAQKIEELPTAGVDPALVEFGRQSASRLRALGASLRGQALKIDADQRTITYDVNVDPGFFGYNVWGGVGYKPNAYDVSSNVTQVRERQAATVTTGAEERSKIWQMLSDDTTAIAKAMADKYRVPFEVGRR
jgi:hypothetical protein